jgi:hypothetical protein
LVETIDERLCTINNLKRPFVTACQVYNGIIPGSVAYERTILTSGVGGWGGLGGGGGGGCAPHQIVWIQIVIIFNEITFHVILHMRIKENALNKNWRTLIAVVESHNEFFLSSPILDFLLSVWKIELILYSFGEEPSAERAKKTRGWFFSLLLK